MVGDNTGDVDVGSLPTHRQSTPYRADETNRFRKQSPQRKRGLDLVVKTRHEALHGGNARTLRLCRPEMANQGAGDAQDKAREDVKEIARRPICVDQRLPSLDDIMYGNIDQEDDGGGNDAQQDQEGEDAGEVLDGGGSAGAGEMLERVRGSGGSVGAQARAWGRERVGGAGAEDGGFRCAVEKGKVDLVDVISRVMMRFRHQRLDVRRGRTARRA